MKVAVDLQGHGFSLASMLCWACAIHVREIRYGPSPTPVRVLEIRLYCPTCEANRAYARAA